MEDWRNIPHQPKDGCEVGRVPYSEGFNGSLSICVTMPFECNMFLKSRSLPGHFQDKT